MDTLGTQITSYSPHWQRHGFNDIVPHWFTRMKKRLSAVSEHSAWWSFVGSYPKQINHWLTALRTGYYRFSPMTQYRFKSNLVTVWSYPDRLMLHCLRQLLTPTFKHVIPTDCVHLSGPTVIKKTTQANTARIGFRY